MLSASLHAGRVRTEYLSLTNHDHQSRVHFQIWGRLSIFHLDGDPGAAFRPRFTHTQEFVLCRPSSRALIMAEALLKHGEGVKNSCGAGGGWAQGYKEHQLGVLERGSLILTTAGTMRGSSLLHSPQAPSAPQCRWPLVERGGCHSLSPASRTTQEALRDQEGQGALGLAVLSLPH